MLICRDSVTAISVNGSDDYVWSTGDTTNSIQVNNSGWYSITASNNCKTLIDSIFVDFQNYPDSIAYTVIEICETGEVVLIAGNESYTYLWSTGESNQEVTVYDIGLYQVTITNFGCELEQQIEVVLCDVELFIPNLITPNGDGKNDTWIIDNLWFTQITPLQYLTETVI
ncbi:MAG: hypothetical protein JKY53_05490 [Flavobacteriales bacterium]|nr:hypothetical protein [Flavobacteriales bacterium]